MCVCVFAQELADVTESRELAVVQLQEERVSFEHKLAELKEHHDSLLQSREGKSVTYGGTTCRTLHIARDCFRQVNGI